MKRHSIAALIAGFGLATGLAGLSAAAAAAEPAASVVIVHGAFADGSDWAKVVPLLQDKGIHVTVVQNPLDSLAGDVAAATRAIDKQPGKVVLVSHSWGGTVITEAGKNDKVASLVYVAAFAPDAGQSVADVSKDAPKSPGIARVEADSQGWLSLPAQAVAEDFAQDVPAREARVMAATQGPIKGSAFGEAVSSAAWHDKPSYYIVSQHDRMIPPSLERSMAKAIGAKITELPTSHVPQRSRPADVARVIEQAVAAVE